MEDAFGGYTHYDSRGKTIGYSREGFMGVTHYDEKGREVGTTQEGYFEITHKGEYNPAVGEIQPKKEKQGSWFLGLFKKPEPVQTVQYREDRTNPAELKALKDLIESITAEMDQLEDDHFEMESFLMAEAEDEQEEREEELEEEEDNI